MWKNSKNYLRPFLSSLYSLKNFSIPVWDLGVGEEGNGLLCFKLFLLTAQYLLTAWEIYCKHWPPCLHLAWKKMKLHQNECWGGIKLTDDMAPANTPNYRCCLDLPVELESLQMFTESLNVLMTTLNRDLRLQKSLIQRLEWKPFSLSALSFYHLGTCSYSRIFRYFPAINKH